MAHKLPPLNWLRSFEAAARHKSFTHAANDLNLTQAAVSKQVKLLEHYLREPLFIRHARSLEMTKTGEAYLPKVRDAFERLSAGTSEIFGQRRSEVFTIRSVASFSVNWLAPRLQDFSKRYPDIRYRIISTIWNDDVGGQQYDLDIRHGTGKWQGLESHRLTWDTLTPVATPDMETPIEEATLIHILGYEEGWSSWLSAANVDNNDDKGGIQVDNSLMAFQLAASGAGMALARSSILGDEVSSGRLVKPFDLEVEAKEAFYAVSPAEEMKHPDAETFRDWLLEQARG